jgi:hypothetical protein
MTDEEIYNQMAKSKTAFTLPEAQDEDSLRFDALSSSPRSNSTRL